MYDRTFFERKERTQSYVGEKLARILIDVYQPKNVIDLGCGTGIYIRPLWEQGIEAVGIENAAIVNQISCIADRILIKDLRNPIITSEKFDLCLCLEVAEHIDQRYEPQLFDNICNASDTIIFSAAIPGQPGEGHINCQPKEYWKQLFTDRGFKQDEANTRLIARRLEYGPMVYWLPRNLMVFNRLEGQDD